MLIQNYWGGTEGGAERQCRKQSRALTALGHEVTVLTRWPGSLVPFRQMDGGVRIVRVGWFDPFWRLSLKLRDLLSPAAKKKKRESFNFV